MFIPGHSDRLGSRKKWSLTEPFLEKKFLPTLQQIALSQTSKQSFVSGEASKKSAGAMCKSPKACNVARKLEPRSSLQIFRSKNTHISSEKTNTTVCSVICCLS